MNVFLFNSTLELALSVVVDHSNHDSLNTTLHSFFKKETALSLRSSPLSKS